jgi:mono/diheme cytochrome c family protein
MSDSHADNAAPRPSDRDRLPRWFIYVALILISLTWVPLAIVALVRSTKSTEPRVHIFQDMDVQPKGKAQAETPLFADGRTMRGRVAGTVAQGEARIDDHYHRGYETGEDGRAIFVQTDAGQKRKYLDGYPDEVTVDMALLRRGRERYNIFCAPCHGQSGNGEGLVHKAAVRTGSQATGWVKPSNIIQNTTVDGEPVSVYGEDNGYTNGELLFVIAHGRRSMPGYASQIPIDDRWAIVAYVRALQLSQNARREDVPTEQLDLLK